jgi:hypothetical protein
LFATLQRSSVVSGIRLDSCESDHPAINLYRQRFQRAQFSPILSANSGRSQAVVNWMQPGYNFEKSRDRSRYIYLGWPFFPIDLHGAYVILIIKAAKVCCTNSLLPLRCRPTRSHPLTRAHSCCIGPDELQNTTCRSHSLNAAQGTFASPHSVTIHSCS